MVSMSTKSIQVCPKKFTEVSRHNLKEKRFAADTKSDLKLVFIKKLGPEKQVRILLRNPDNQAGLL